MTIAIMVMGVLNVIMFFVASRYKRDARIHLALFRDAAARFACLNRVLTSEEREAVNHRLQQLLIETRARQMVEDAVQHGEQR